jgi:hypothetical protein
MTTPSRREFLTQLTAAAPVAAVMGRMRLRSSQRLDPVMLRALAGAVLPTSLGEEGIDRIATAFQTWLERYEPNAERNHGYGTGEIERNPADPTPRWTRQLQALNGKALETYGEAFPDISRANRQRVVALDLEGIERLSDPVFADHVAVALLAFFYDSPQAANLCYGAAINPQTCRPLAESPNPPVPLPLGRL